MSEWVPRYPRVAGLRPEREIVEYTIIDRWMDRCRHWSLSTMEALRGQRRGRVRQVLAAADALDSLSDTELQGRLADVRQELRLQGVNARTTIKAFALVRETAGRVLGMRHYHTQVQAGLALLRGRVAEMATGEGKTLAATLPAAAAALAGVPVHVVTVNDYLAERDAREMGPLYEALGISVGWIVHDLSIEERREIYARDVVYCANKEIVFDYLKDRLLAADVPRLGARWRRLLEPGSSGGLILRGLHFAIVDEADSVLVDEARTPLVISGSESLSETEAGMLRQGFDMAAALVEERDFTVRDERVRMTPTGEDELTLRMQPLGGLWRNTEYREAIVNQALAAQHRLIRDRDYVVDNEGQVQIVDPFTGRIMPGRSWGLGLHQMVELKEGVEMTKPRETMAEISYQNFFRKFCHLSGMTGTAVEVRAELRGVYALQCEVIPTLTPPRRRRTSVFVATTADEKIKRVTDAAAAIHATGQPLLIGTATVEASERIAAAFTTAGISHRVLNARQDSAEADVIAQAGQRDAVTIATSMAGRGTDIKLGETVADLGGLHVLITELQASARVDRQLEGRSARQGDPGAISYIVALDDALLVRQRNRFVRIAGAAAAQMGRYPAFAYLRYQQRRIARQHYKQRMRMVKTDTARQRSLSFAQT